MLLGLLNTANRHAQEEAFATYMGFTEDNLNFMFGCKTKMVEKTLETPVAVDDIDVGAS